MSDYAFKLYVTGSSARSENAIGNLQRLCADRLRDRYTVEVIDVLLHPERAEEDRILTTPTLVKEAPPPARRITGDLANTVQMVRLLALDDDNPNGPGGAP